MTAPLIADCADSRAQAPQGAPPWRLGLSAPLMALFPQGVAAAELCTDALLPATRPDDPNGDALAQARALLTEREWRSIAGCRAARIRDYTAGRLCARRALAELGIERFSLLSARDRRALWPAGFSGSITHAAGYAAAVTGPQAHVGSLGLDTERIDAVEARLWPEFCTAADWRQLDEWPEGQRPFAAALCFVAKEAFHKAQFALCAQPLGFDAVWIASPPTALGQGMFRVHPLRTLQVQSAGAARLATPAWTGHFRRHGAYVSAGIALSLV